jgi:sterol desaturase/sphingolipid hydroxylase (fatty acid hydroxylase superfamily)
MDVERFGTLPQVGSPSFYALSLGAIFGPYALTLLTYVYHFQGRKTGAKLRRENDAPKPAHQTDWVGAIRRPEGITAVVAYYMAVGLGLAYALGWDFVIPAAVKDVSTLVPNPLAVGLYFFVFDSVMWGVHFTQHHIGWLYQHTHAVHHTIKSPTILSALTGYLPDTCLLIILPLHATLFIVPGGNFASVFVFAGVSLLHLHLIHSEFTHSWDPLLRKAGIVNSWDHHVHHLRPRRNFAHFFTAIDRVFGTYDDPFSVPKLKDQLKDQQVKTQ